jgi:hypothetical protein
MALCPPIAVILLLVLTSATYAAPLVPPSDQPGRERYRFEPEPRPPAKPLLRWDCDERGARRGKPRTRRNPNC